MTSGEPGRSLSLGVVRLAWRDGLVRRRGETAWRDGVARRLVEMARRDGAASWRGETARRECQTERERDRWVADGVIERDK